MGRSRFEGNLSDGVTLSGAHGILVNVMAETDFRMDEFAMVAEAARKFATEAAPVMIGAVLNESSENESSTN